MTMSCCHWYYSNDEKRCGSEGKHKRCCRNMEDEDTYGGHNDSLNIMLISWFEGIAYREGMLSMLESDWIGRGNRSRCVELLSRNLAAIDHSTSLAP